LTQVSSLSTLLAFGSREPGVEEDGVAERLAVIGGGTMGIGIAYVSAMAGISTSIVEASPQRAVVMMEEFQAALDSASARGKITAGQADEVLSRVRRLAHVEELDTGLDVIIESVPERVEIKQAVLHAAAGRSPRILASNTSSMSITALSEYVSDASSFLGMHFFNPVWSIGLVEVVKGASTSLQTLDLALDLVTQLGKQSAVIADAPGFATSRLDLVAALEAMRMVEAGVGTAADIDRAVQLAYRHPVGPLTLSDIVGLDVRLDIALQLESSLGDRFRPPQILRDLVAQGHLGKKTGRGFLAWE